ncbi:MAG: DUF2804 domain-containing protein [Actinomycetota bacterium]|nr:DUF2804 domain-containing protein [Actinomycetota bacterium]
MAIVSTRGPAVRDAGLPLPPARMRGARRGRPLKRWRYLGAYSPEVMACVCEVRLGAIPQRFWAVAEPGRPILTRTTTGRGGVRIDGSHAQVEAGDVRIDLRFEEDGGVESLHPSGRGGFVWTRKQAGIPVRGTVEAGGRRFELDCLGVIDDTAGYHRRRTDWRWCAGVGRTDAGEPVGWNLVSGVNDPPKASERAIWVGGEEFEPGPVEIAEDLSRVDFAEGGRLSFEPWSERAERTNLLLVRSSYRQPFGTFRGELPGGFLLSEGLGVMEWHSVVW